MWRISGVIDGGLVNALVEMVLAMVIRLLNETTIETVCCLYHQKKDFISVPYEPKDDDYLKNR